MTAAISTADFVASIGVNTHLDYSWSSYAATTTVDTEINYLGIKNIRDAMSAPNDSALFQAVAAATGAKFDIYLSLSSFVYASQVSEIAGNANIVRYVEGVNESDEISPAITYNGQSGFAATAALQQLLYTMAGSTAGFSTAEVIGPSYGIASSFATAPDSSATSAYGNTHEYFGTGNPPSSALASMIANAQLVSGSNPIIATEAGYYTGSSLSPGAAQFAQSGVDQMVQAKYDLTLLFDDWAAGIKNTYLFELMDNAADPGNTNFEDHYGLFNADGTPKLAATALHNLVSILSDNGTPRTDALGYQLTGMPATANSLLMEKSTGVFELAMWNDVRLWSATSPVEVSNPAVPVTVNFGQIVQTVTEYDPITGASAVLTWSDVSSVTLNLIDHPIILEVTPFPAGVLSLASFVLPEAVAAGQATGNLWSLLVGNATETNPNWLAGVTISAVGTGGTAGTLSFNAATQTLTYQAPAYNPFNPTDSFTYTLTDTHGDTVTGSVAISEIAPAATTYAMVANTRTDAPAANWTLVSEASGQSLYGNALGGTTLMGGADTNMYGAGTNNTLIAGAGNHYAGGSGNNARVTLGNGNNTIALSGTGNTVTTGNGNNIVWKPIGSTTITMGNGNETITVGGLHNAITIGTGTSTINAGNDGAAAGYEQVTVGGGTNKINLGGANDSVVVRGGTGNAILSSGGQASIEIDAGTNSVNAQANGNTLTLLAGTNSIATNGSSNVITGGAGTDTVWASGNANTITGGTGSDTITITGTGDTIVFGAGNTVLTEYGSNNTITLGAAGSPQARIYGNVVAKNDVIDLRTALAATNWDGQQSDLANYLAVRVSGAASIISIDPDGTGSGAASDVATLYNTANLTLPSLLAHAILPAEQQNALLKAAPAAPATTGVTETDDGHSVLTIAGSTTAVNAAESLASYTAASPGTTAGTFVLTGWNNSLNPGPGMNFLDGGSGKDIFVLNAAGQGVDTIAGFKTAVGDTLDLSRTLAGLGVAKDLSNLGSYVTSATSMGSTTLYVDPTGGHGTATAFAILQNVPTTVAGLIAHQAITG